MISIQYSNGRLIVKDPSSIDVLRKGFFGEKKGINLVLTPEEALYLIDMRNAACKSNDKDLSFNTLASRFWKAPKFSARYFTYKDWRDRGLIIKPESYKAKAQRAGPRPKEYPRSSLRLPKRQIKGIFFKSDLITTIDQSEKGKELYENFWIGQYGSYKAADRGRLNKLDVYETMLLLSKGVLDMQNTSKSEILKLATDRRQDFPELYSVYSDWREKGYIIKTGFKFGTHFRVYFPGARPQKDENSPWVHSKHVIHVFARESRLLTSELARVIRVAHSVRKTFILAVPGTSRGKKVPIDFLLYHRKSGYAENPQDDSPRYGMLSLSEEEIIGGNELSGAIKEARNRKLDLVIAIADRETAVTYYRVRQIKLKGSSNEYYEIEWMQP